MTNLEIYGLTKVYDRKVQALRGIDLFIPPGMFGLLGPNGAGKTTLMRILAGILQPTSGQVHFGPYDLSTPEGSKGLKKVLGYLPQDLGLYPDLSAAEFLNYVAILKGISNQAERQKRIESLLETVALSDVAGQKLKGFSGGMKRRVGIAQALLNDPQLLIVDEPTAGLDPEERIRFRNLLVGLAGNRSILLSTHIVEDIAQTSPRLAVLAKGRVVFQGLTAELLNAARGKVWTVNTTGPTPVGNLTVVSALNTGAEMRYRIVAAEQPSRDAVQVEPNLEDGYVATMQNAGL